MHPRKQRKPKAWRQDDQRGAKWECQSCLGEKQKEQGLSKMVMRQQIFYEARKPIWFYSKQGAKATQLNNATKSVLRGHQYHLQWWLHF